MIREHCSKCIYIIAWFAIIAALIMMGIFIFWALCPYKLVEFSTQPFPVQNKIVKHGDYVFYRVDYCKYTDLIPEISKTFVNSVLYTIEPAIGSKNPKGCDTNIVQTYVSKALYPGEYYINIVYRYHPNPIREIDIVTRTESFTIIE